MPELSDYRDRGARALVLLHERQMRECLDVWRRAKAAGMTLPKTEDRDYQSLETLLVHIFRAARGYMTWICEKLALPEPELPVVPEASEVEAKADAFVAGLLKGWRLPLRDVPGERFGESHTTRWGDELPIEAMLEHAVVHPMRHRFQLSELMEATLARRDAAGPAD
jgi:uncharacterized damage-inducible protein DinB